MPNTRTTDPRDSEEWKKRQIPVVATSPPLINGQFGKLLGYGKAVKELGLEPLLVVIFLGWLVGLWTIPVVDKYFNTMIADDILILKKIDDIQRGIDAATRDRARIVQNLFQAFRIACENSARASKDENARAACGNIHE